MIESPCVNWCEMNPATGYCLGCCRTIDEIASWSTLSDDQQRAIHRQLLLRKAPRADDPSSTQLP